MLGSGCHVIDFSLNKVGYQKIDTVNAKIEQVETEAAKKQKELENKLHAQFNGVIEVQNAKLQGAANELFAANYAHTLNLTPDRNSIVVNYHVKTAQEYVKLPPTMEAVQKYLIEVKDELDETRTSLSDLQKKYEIEKVKADKLESTKNEFLAQIEQIKKDKLAIESEKNDIIKNLQKEKDIALKELLSKQQEELDNAKDTKDLIRKIMYFTGALALIALLAAIYIPLMRFESGLTAAILGVVTISLPFVTPLIVGLIGGGSILGLVSWVIIKHNIDIKKKEKIIETEQRVGSNLVNAIQDVKDKAKDVFDSHIKPSLEEWNNIVTTDNHGNITKVKDSEVIKSIDKKLITSNRK